ncbi:hypothetical protein BpHYR1_010797 [Brachionus plicatilis]|uniref:Uncharacterized protein n=1 Tax=Brachionus plicatilis TaxID=10195 RepID=A0A3M7QW67_BRAPC|nr:hypothetical protein BpHYR1_010797 [Brachionus plicatilis]
MNLFDQRNSHAIIDKLVLSLRRRNMFIKAYISHKAFQTKIIDHTAEKTQNAGVTSMKRKYPLLLLKTVLLYIYMQHLLLHLMSNN